MTDPALPDTADTPDENADTPDESADGVSDQDLGEHGVGAAPEPARAAAIEQASKAPQPTPTPPPRRTGVFLDPEDLRDHVGDLLRAMLGRYEVDAQGNYTFLHETARIFVTFGVSPVGPTVGVFSITNLEVDFTEELGAFLLNANHQMAFGAFSYDHQNRSVWLKHTLLGTMLDGPELQATLMAIASTATEVDDAIKDKFGGRAFHDAPKDEVDRTRPPAASDDPSSSNATGYL